MFPESQRPTRLPPQGPIPQEPSESELPEGVEASESEVTLTIPSGHRSDLGERERRAAALNSGTFRDPNAPGFQVVRPPNAAAIVGPPPPCPVAPAMPPVPPKGPATPAARLSTPAPPSASPEAQGAPPLLAQPVQPIICWSNAEEPPLPLPQEEAHPYRPLARPPMALLCIFDDGQTEGEWIRLRSERVRIGRTEGDILIPHDPAIADCHAELSRVIRNGRYRWYLTDLRSPTGTFVRIGSALLRHGQELLIGSRRYRFEHPTHSAAAEWLSQASPEEVLRSEHPKRRAVQVPTLIEVFMDGREGISFELTQAVHWLGRDPNRCDLLVPDDPLLSPKHCRLYRNADGAWYLDQTQTLNGTWLRIGRMAIDSLGQFQLGEQRFLLWVL